MSLPSLPRLTERRRAAALARALDDPRASAGPDVTPLVLLSRRLEAAAPSLVVAPDPAFADALRRRLLAVAAVQGIGVGVASTTTAPATARLRDAIGARVGQRGLAVAAGSMAAMVAVAGVGVAGSRSLPGDPFYDVKRTTEAIQLSTAGGDLARGQRHLQFAETRLREVRALATGKPLALGPVAPGQPSAAGLALGGSLADRVISALDEMDGETRDGQRLMVAVHERTGDEKPLDLLSAMADRQARGLREVAALLPAAAKLRALASAAMATGVAASAQAIVAGDACDAACQPGTNPAGVPGASGGAPGGSPAQPGGTPVPQLAPTPGRPCSCPTPKPATTPRPSERPSPSTSGPRPSPQPSTSPGPSPTPTPTPTPSPTPLLPLPDLPSPAPAPTLPPEPTLPPAPAPGPLPTTAPDAPGVTTKVPTGASTQSVPLLPAAPAAPAVPTVPGLTTHPARVPTLPVLPTVPPLGASQR